VNQYKIRVYWHQESLYVVSLMANLM